MKFRQMKKTDIENVSKLIKNVILYNFSKVYPKEVINNFCRHNSVAYIKKNMDKVKYYVAEDKNQIIAVAGIMDNVIKSFHVDVKHQGQGVGKKFMKFLERLYTKHGLFNKIIVHSSIPAVKFYEKCGFVKIKHEIYTIPSGKKYTTILMEKKIFKKC